MGTKKLNAIITGEHAYNVQSRRDVWVSSKSFSPKNVFTIVSDKTTVTMWSDMGFSQCWCCECEGVAEVCH